MKNYINFENVNCKDCYKCLRNCPVKSMKFINHQAEVIEDECILCGNCYLTCPQKAKEIRNDIPAVKTLLMNNTEVYVSLAPSFVANYKGVNFASMKDALLRLGFKDVEETAIGAEIVSREYEKLISEKKNDVIISTCCPSVNLLIRKYYPDLVKYMAPVASPMIVHARKIKEEHKNACVVFIGPCLSKKEEVDENPDVINCAITFEKLTKWMKEENIEFKNIPDGDKKYNTRLYPTASGIIRTMEKDPEYAYLTVDGIEKCKEALVEVASGNLSHCFLEMSSCTNSCINGPGMDKESRFAISNYINIVNFSGKEKYNVKISDTSKNYTPTPLKQEYISDEIIKMLLSKIGKYKQSDELNCGSCGYDTCREKAKAMYNGKTEVSMCLPYLKNKAMSYMDDIVANTPNGIIILNEKLEVELINKSACKIINLKSSEVINNQPIARIMDPSLYLNVLNTKENIYNDICYLSEYRRYVNQNVIYDENYKIIMVIMRNITDEIKDKRNKEEISRQTIEVTDKVIQKQMRAVQEIASLLGETTAETKVALEKLKETLDEDK